MAQQALNDGDAAKWKLGAPCSLFNRDDRKWTEGAIIGSFSNEHGEWVKVQCGQRVHDVLTDDPDLKVQDQNTMVILADNIKELQVAAFERPDIAPIVQRVIASSPQLQSALNDATKSCVIRFVSRFVGCF